MSFDYNELLRRQIHELNTSDYEFEVDEEQEFIKNKDIKPNTIHVLTRFLQNDNSIGVDTQPIQILILSEQNQLEFAKSFFSDYAKTYNFKAYMDNSIWVKQQYSDPVVLSNFNTFDYGYRSILYLSATIYVMYDVVDLRDLRIDNQTYDVLTFDISYTMTPNSQQVTGSNNFITKSVKTASSLAINITLPVVKSELITKVLEIVNETDTTTTDTSDSLSYGGNENFYFDFYLGDTHFNNKRFKLVTLAYGSAINNIPAIRLGFMR